MALLILTPGRDMQDWVAECKKIDPDIDIRIYPQVGNSDDIVFALTWNHPHGELLRYKNLQCISSLGAGVDHIFRDHHLPHSVKITRIVDPLLVQSMVEYVLMIVLNHFRKYDVYRQHQTDKNWQKETIPNIRDFKIGVMGLGEIGGEVAKRLAMVGFQMVGWSRTKKQIDGVQSFAAAEQLKLFLAQSNYLVCLLPLTPQTEGILNRDTFRLLPKGAYLINVARGEHLIEADLLEALQQGRLSGACLDVFREEPLPRNHPFWRHPGIMITPHIASITDPVSAATQVVENYHRLKKNQPLLHEVDPAREY